MFSGEMSRLTLRNPWLPSAKVVTPLRVVTSLLVGRFGIRRTFLGYRYRLDGDGRNESIQETRAGLCAPATHISHAHKPRWACPPVALVLRKGVRHGTFLAV